LPDARAEAAWLRFKQVADTKREVTDEDLRKIVASTEIGGHQAAGDAPDNHVADTLRHLIFG
jgi:hypothetical protein